jgi:hypothetical protein
MSENNLSQENMQALVAGIGSRLRNIFRGLRRGGSGWANSGGNSPEARRARVAMQPRDSKGRWIPTGASIRANVDIPFAGGRKTISMSNLKAIGSTPDGKKIRALVINNDHVKDHPSLAEGNVIELDPKTVELLVAKLDRAFLEKKGIDPDLQHDLPKTLQELPTKVEDLNAKEADDLDIDLALGGLEEEEDKELRAERDAEPLAKLPPALAEKAAEGQEVRDIVEAAEEGKPQTQRPLTEAEKEFLEKKFPSMEEMLEQVKRDREAGKGYIPYRGGPSTKQQRGEAPTAYGIKNREKFYALPNGTILDQYERTQFYPSPEDYRGASGPMSRQIIKKDGKWHVLGKNGEAKGKPLKPSEVSELLRGGQLSDTGAASKLDEDGNKVPAWADEVAPSAKPVEDIKPDQPSSGPAGPDDLDSLDDEDFEDIEEEAPEPAKPEPKKPEPKKPEPKPEPVEEVSPETEAIQKRIDDLKSKVEADPDKREVLDSIGEARKALNRGKTDEASSWLDEAEALDAEIDKAKSNKKRKEDLKANVPEVKEDPDKVDRTIGDEKAGYLAKEMGKPGSKQREYFWETVDRITSDPKQKLNGFAQGRIADAYTSELLEKLDLSDAKLDPQLESLVDGSKTRDEVISAIKEKANAEISKLIKALPRERLPREGNKEAIKTALEFAAEDKIDERLDNLLPTLENKLKPAGREYSKEELEALSRIDRINAIQGLEPITEEVKKTPTSEIAKQNKVSDFEGDFGTLPNGDNIIPSEEQKNVVSAIISKVKRIAVNALAGSGKTTTLVGAANALAKRDPNARIFVWQFGRDNREQAMSRFSPDSTLIHTFDSAGYNFGDQNLRKNYDNKAEKARFYNTSDQDIAAELRIEGDMPNKVGENLTLAEQARLAKDIVDRFSYSADTEITERHIYDPEDSLTPENKEKLLKYARRYWRTATASTAYPKYAATREGRRGGGYTGPGSIAPTNNLLTKKWALTNPDLGQLKHPDGSPITHVFVDEAQDINPVISNLLEKQGDNIQIVAVGDSNQAIYAFRGAVDGLSRMTKKSEAELRLTQTRRFGKGLLDLPNAALNLLGYDSRIESTVDGGEYTDDIEIDGSKGLTALIVRNNYNGVTAILGMLARGKKVAVPSKFKEDLMGAVEAMEWLEKDPATRPPRPSGFPEDFATISTMQGLAAFARNKDNAKTRAAFWHRILNGDAFEGSVQKLRDFSEKVTVLGQASRGTEDFSGTEGATGVLAKTSQGDLTYVVKDGYIYLSGKGINEKLPNSSKTFKETVLGGFTSEQIRNGKNPNWIGILPGGSRKPDQSPLWTISPAVGPDGKKITGPDGKLAFETKFKMPDEADRAQYLKNMASLFSEEATPDVVVTTAHRSKGLEFDNVIIGDDFPGPDTEDKDAKQSESGIPSIDELDLAFVAVTRAKKKLNPGSLAWLSQYKGEEGLKKANSELGRVDTSNPYKEQKPEADKTDNYDFSDISMGAAQGPRLDEDDEDRKALEQELTREPVNAFEVTPDSFEGNIGSYFEDPDAEGVYVKLTDIVRTEDEDGEPLFEMYGKYADGSDFEGVYDINRRLKEVTFAEPVAKTPTKKPAEKPAPTPTPATTPNIKKTKATEILPGSSLYDAEGNEMGEVISKKKQLQKSTNREIVAVTYRDKDGNEQVKRYFADSDVDVDNKGLDVVETPPKPEPKAKPKTVKKTDGDSPDVEQAKSDWADYIRLDNEWSQGGPTWKPMDPQKRKERNDKLLELAEKYKELGAENRYAQEFLRLLPKLQNLPKELKGSDYEKALRERLLALRDKGQFHRSKFVNDLDKGKLNVKDIPIDESLFGDIPEPQNTPINKLNDTELPTIFGSSWSTNRDGTFSKVVDGVRWNIRENNDGSISVRNRTHGGATQKFKSWSDAEAAFPDLLEDGKKQNRESLKRFIAPYDSDGSIAKMIDNGDSAEDIHAALLANTDFMDALARRDILPISYMSKIDRLGTNRQTPPTLDRTNIGPKKLVNPVIPPGYIQTPAGILPQKFANRADNGSEFDVPVDLEAIRDLTPGGRQEQLEQLFESFPDAKFAPDGSIVIYRKTKKEPHGPKRGQRFTTELRVQGDARQNQWKIIIKVTDPTGESKEYMHYSGHNSWESLIGRANESREGNGISDMLDKYFNRDAGFFKRKGKRLGWGPEKIAKQERVWGGVAGALKRLRTSNSEATLEKILKTNSKGQDLVLRTIEEHAAITLNGIDEELATDLNWWRKRFSGISSFWDALDKNDNDAAATLFNHFSLSLPDNDDARARALAIVSDGIDQLYPGANGKTKKDMLRRAASALKRSVVPADEVDPRAKPFVDKNGVTLKEGDRVQWESNVYGKSTGQIVRFLPLDTTKDGEFSFTDYVMVKFKGKKKPERLVASNMKRVDKDTNPITEYSFWLRNDDLKIARAKKAGYSYDPDRHAIIDSDGDIVERLGADNSDNEDGDDGDDDTGGGGGTPPVTPTNQPPAPAGQTTPPAGQPTTPTPPAATTTATEEFIDVDSLTPDNITAGAFANPTKKIKTTKVKRKNVGELLPFGNVQPDPNNKDAATRAKIFYSVNNISEEDRAALVDDPENTIVYDPKKSSSAKKTIGGIGSQDQILIVKPTPETKKAKDTLVAKGASLWEKAKSSAAYKKVKKLQEQLQELVDTKEEKYRNLKNLEKEYKPLIDASNAGITSAPETKAAEDAYNEWVKSLPKASSSFTGRNLVSDELAARFESLGGVVEIGQVSESSKSVFLADRSRSEKNLEALLKFLKEDTDFSDTQISDIHEVYKIANSDGQLNMATFMGLPSLNHLAEIAKMEEGKPKDDLISKLYSDRIDSLSKFADAVKKQEELTEARRDYSEYVQDSFAESKRRYDAWKLERALFMRDSLREAGVVVGNRSIDDFGSLIDIKGGNADKRQKIRKAFDEALSFMPDASVDNLIEYLRSTNNKLSLFASGRGSFSAEGDMKRLPTGDPSGSIEINAGSGGTMFNPQTAFGSEYTDTMLHELWHFIQYTNPNLGAIESSYMFDKLVDSETGEIRHDYGTVKGYKSADKELGLQGMFQEEYMAKLYPKKGLNAVLNPDERSSELSTVLMQGLFTEPRYSGAPTGRKIYVKEGRDTSTYIDSRDGSLRPLNSISLYAYYNPADGKYYKDSAFSIPLESRGAKIVNTSGYGIDDQGEEDELMGLAFGLMHAFDGGE